VVSLVIGALAFALLVAIAIWERRLKTGVKKKSAQPNSLAQVRGVEYSYVVLFTLVVLCLVPVVLGLAIVCFDYITGGYGDLVTRKENVSVLWEIPVAMALANILPFGTLYWIVLRDIRKHGAARYGSLCRMFVALAVTSLPAIYFGVALTITALAWEPGMGAGVSIFMGAFVIIHLFLVVPAGLVLGWALCRNR
jgi:hypothetical protein